ncbi:protein cueball [Scaptodrosophila lebanonensis]|uniref:Protein cueball n=1 Tax=Drosophila lebanonensis TaxID=7225 RepID=A0A6J2TXC8_DROLE|nr:protein cueball [Scaptodrosophila lebanonensis]
MTLCSLKLLPITYLLLVIAATCLIQVAGASSWAFAVTLKSKIVFFDEHWNELTSAAHKFTTMSALAFDESQEFLYFSDQLHQNESIFSLKVPTNKDPDLIESVVQRSKNETVRGIAYDPLNRNLYWTDSQRRKIFFLTIEDTTAGTKGQMSQEPQVLIDFANENSTLDGLAVDFCGRKLYWTNSNHKNATVERIGLDGTSREVIVGSNLFMPHGIFVDQLSNRIYWVDDLDGHFFAIESAQLDGSDRRLLYKGINNMPWNLVVTKDAIYWTDLQHNAVWTYDLHESDANTTLNKPRKVLSFPEQAQGIVARLGFYQNMRNDPDCAGVVRKVEARLKQPMATRSPVDRQVLQLQQEHCLNGGSYVVDKDICICDIGYKGVRCESSECHNFCVHGTCEISAAGFAKCYCQKGFYGERCQLDKCSSYCLNEGVCIVDSTGDPNCECRDNFGGQRCEHNSTEICALFCRILKYEPETNVPFGCHDICEELTLRTENGIDTYAIPRFQQLELCRSPDTWRSSLILLFGGGVVACLALIALIVHGLRRIYKPARPRIKKTFVVRKQARTNSSSDTPLTNRPLATEQCEITIENCCNMNICETPCFDPKLVEQTLSSRDNKVRVKEDKKILIHNMEDDLY